MLQVERFAENPIIHPGLDASLGDNINGPSLVRAPSWVANPLGRYYLYFAHHGGKYIRLAYADDLHGPWRIYVPGTLRLEQTCGLPEHHVASPDVHVDEASRQVRMYFHTPVPGAQRTFLATSSDGLHFEAESVDLGPSYFRVFEHQGAFYCVTMNQGCLVMRSPDGRQAFEPGPRSLPRMRHAAVQKVGEKRLRVVFSRGGDCPEHLLVAEMSLEGDWRGWQMGEAQSLLEPKRAYEGADLPLEASHFGAAPGRVRQLRDPAIFEEEGRTYLVYSCAGESGLGMGELVAGG